MTGASSGIGLAAARRLAAAGFAVVAVARRADALAPLAAQGMKTAAVDLAEPGAVASLWSSVERWTAGAGVEALVHAAGWGAAGALAELPLAVWQRQWDIHVGAALALTQAALPAMRRRKRGRLVFLSSAVTQLTLPLLGAYCASKRALEAMAEALAMELAGSGIQVAVVRPGNVDTAFDDRMRKELERWRPGDSPYAAAYGRLGGGALAGGASAEAVASVIERAVLSRRPRLYYNATWDARALAGPVRWLPLSWRLAIARRIMLG